MADRTTFFTIDRKLLSDPMWLREPFTYGQAWIDLIGRANFADKSHIYKGAYQQVKRGQLPTSILELSTRWHWSRKKTSNYLNALERAHMITQKRTSNGTTLTIENYGFYQDRVTTKRTTKEQRKNIGRTSEDTHNNKENKENKENHISRRPSVEEIGGYASSIGADVDPQEFYDYYAAADWTAGGRPINDWKALLRSWGSKPRTHTSGDIMAAMFASGWGKTNDN